MARQLGFQYPGAVYHIMARGDGEKCISPGKENHLSFLHWLEQGGTRAGDGCGKRKGCAVNEVT